MEGRQRGFCSRCFNYQPPGEARWNRSPTLGLNTAQLQNPYLARQISNEHRIRKISVVFGLPIQCLQCLAHPASLQCNARPRECRGVPLSWGGVAPLCTVEHCCEASGIRLGGVPLNCSVVAQPVYCTGRSGGSLQCPRVQGWGCPAPGREKSVCALPLHRHHCCTYTRRLYLRVTQCSPS